MMASKKNKEIPEEISSLSFEKALSQLEDIVRQLEGGEKDLDESLDAYERGALLKAHCEDKLKKAQLRVEKISLSSNGEPELSPVEVD